MESDGNKHVKVALCLPWYNGADRDAVGSMLAFQHYLGRLQERAWWMTNGRLGEGVGFPPKLDPYGKGSAELTVYDIGTTFEFGIVEEVGCSLPGMARERCVDAALAWGAEYLLFYDDDMLFPVETFLRLYRNQKDVCAALAFTSREPITPVIYKFNEFSETFQGQRRLKVDIEPVWDYQKDALQKVDAVGAGVVLINARVFSKLTKPYFNSPGLGEDIFFCMMCRVNKVEVWVDTRVKTIHKPAFPQTWHDENSYEASRQKDKEAAEAAAQTARVMP